MLKIFAEEFQDRGNQRSMSESWCLEFREAPSREKVMVSQDCFVDCPMVFQLALMLPILQSGVSVCVCSCMQDPRFLGLET